MKLRRFTFAARHDRRAAPRLASVEGVQSKLQRVVRLALEHMRADATAVLHSKGGFF